MAHDCNSGACASRRDLLKIGAAGLTVGFFGLTLPNKLFLQEAYGITPVNPLYDAVIQIHYDGGPSQTDTWDPKPGSANNVFGNEITLSANDIYGKPIKIAPHFTDIANLVNTAPTDYGLGIFRSMMHGNGDHGTAQMYMSSFWGTVSVNMYPSTACVMSYYFQGQGIGIPAVIVNGANAQGDNDPRGANIPTALAVNVGQGQGGNPTVQALQLPAGVSAARYARRRKLMEKVNEGVLGSRPDDAVKAYDKAWKDAYDITTKGDAAKAFDLTGKPLLTGGPNARANDLMRLTLAQELVKSGIPYVTVGIGGNDTHSNNRAGVAQNWGDITDKAVAKMAQNLKATGKRVLIVMGGEFGRTPNSVAGGRDGRDHYPNGFSWAALSVNQPKFKTTAIGDTGPDGILGTNAKDPVNPKDLGATIYKALGFNVGNDVKFDVPTALRLAPPVDRINTSDQIMKWLGLA